MQIIPVLDLAAGVAVHARGGDRARYQPVKSVLAPASPGDPLALFLAYRKTLGAQACYVADLDAIQGGPVQRGLLRELANFETGFAGTLLMDAGTSTAGGALEVLGCGASQVVVGLETLRAFADLDKIVGMVGPSRTAFSLDLHLNNPVLHPMLQDAHGAGADPVTIAEQAVASGAATLLVVDIGRAGTGCGVDLGLLEVLRRHCPGVRLLAGGGVLTPRDLDRMRDVGCDGVLIASALHLGRITASDIAQLGDQSPTSSSRYLAD